MDHSNARMQQLHKRQRVTATTATTVSVNVPSPDTTNTRIFRNRTTATPAAITTETTPAVTTTEETTTSTRRRPAVTSTDTSTPPASTTSSTVAAEDDDQATTAASRNRAETTTSNATGSPAAGFNSATAINATPKNNNNESSSSNGGAIAGAIIAVIAVLAIGVGGYFVYRRRKNAKAARGSGTGLIGGGGSYKKQDEGNDSYGNEGNGTFGATRDDSSLFGGREKTFSAESIGGAYGSTGGGGNNDWTQPTQQSAGPPASQYSSWNTPVAYPPSNQPLPASTANLLSNQPQSTSNLLPASLAAGAAGIGATRLLQQQSQPYQSSTEPFSTDSQYQSIEQRELQQELDNRRQSFMNKTQPPPPVPQVSQEQEDESSPFGESEGQGEVREVKGTFDPSLDDELVLYPGDKVQVLMKYDDGWALGLNLSSGVPPSKGVFPFDCLGEIVPAPTSSEIRSASSPTPIARSLSPIDPANIPLPPPTPTLLSPIGEDDQPPQSQSHQFSSGPPQLAPFERSDSPLSPDFPPSVHASRNSLMLPGGGSPVKANGEKLKRHSSLIASRDADLFVALGEVLDKEKH